MEQYYSTLELSGNDETARAPELVRYDWTARAPECNHNATTFELDADALAPQTVPDTAPQVFYDTSLLEAQENSPEEHASSHHTTKPALKWLLIVNVMVLVIAAAIAVGTGIGLWRHHHEHSSQKSSISPQYILNDTSLAALSFPNGDRHLFFQNNAGLIKRVVRTASNNNWSMSANQYMSFYFPKNYTPLAVNLYAVSGEPQIELYYVSEYHILTSGLSTSDSWGAGTVPGNYSTAVDTRSLSVSSISSTLSSTATNLALLYYENPNGTVSALLQRGNPDIESSVQWIDITSEESKSGSDGPFSTPFVSGTNFSFSPGIGALFYTPYTRPVSGGPPVSGASVSKLFFLIGPSGPGNFSAAFAQSIEDDGDSVNQTRIRQSDIAMFGLQYAIWINGTKPVLYTSDGGAPDNALPDNAFLFARLASVTLADGSATFLYHQINGTTFAEEQWDDSLTAWIPSEYITVSGS